jgi:uncharacterized membrane protein
MTNEVINEADRLAIQGAIREAEQLTSGEIRVHIDKKCAGDPLKRAIQVFNKLKMHATKERNGVLIYLSFTDRKLAILGDEGIDKKWGLTFGTEPRINLLKTLKKINLHKE